jgi:hypothetical protein
VKRFFALLALILGLTGTEIACANQVLFGSPVTVTVTGTSTQVLAANSLRSYLIIQNNGSQNAIIKFGSAQTGTEGIVIIPGGNYEPIWAPANSVFAISASSTTSLTILQGQ